MDNEMRANEFITEAESYQPPELTVGDKILKGKFKNSPAEIKGFTKDKHNQPVLKTNKGDVQLFKPRVAKLMKEAFDQPYQTKSEKSESGSYDVLAKLPDGTNLSIMFNNEGDDEWQVEFYRNNSQEVTGGGDAQRVFATVLNAIQKFIKKHKPQLLRFSASKEVEPGQNSQSRAKLYDRLVQRYANAWGYEMYQEDHGDQVTYELTPSRQGVAEEELTELFSPGKAWKWSFTGSEEAVAVFHVGEIPYMFRAYTYSDTPGVWEVEFKNAERGQSKSSKFGLTGTGNSAEVMSTIADIMRAFLEKYKDKIERLVFTAKESSRQALYARMAKRLMPGWKLVQIAGDFILTAPR